LAQARLKESTGEWDAALNLLDEARRGYVKTAIPNLQPIEAHKARVYLKQGRLDKAQAWVWERNVSTEDDVCYLNEYEHLTLIRVRLTEGSFSGINDLLERLLVLAETQKRTGSVIEILLTHALVHQAQGNRPQALAALEHALTLAEPEGYLRTFVDEGEPMRLLILDFRSTIEESARNGVHPLSGYVDKLLTVFPQPPATAAKSKIENLKSQIVEPLSEREMEVLRLLRSELSGPEIAQQLIVSLNTLRTHTKNIFNKLGVNNRRAAIHRAEELDLF
jgi:LuxR family maltose regulon positive regulatory protein